MTLNEDAVRHLDNCKAWMDKASAQLDSADSEIYKLRAEKAEMLNLLTRFVESGCGLMSLLQNARAIIEREKGGKSNG